MKLSEIQSEFLELWKQLVKMSDLNIPNTFAELVVTEQLHRGSRHNARSSQLSLALILYYGKSGSFALAVRSHKKNMALSLTNQPKEVIFLIDRTQKLISKIETHSLHEISPNAPKDESLHSQNRSLKFGPKARKLIGILDGQNRIDKSTVLQMLFADEEDWHRAEQKLRALLYRINQLSPGMVVSQSGQIFLTQPSWASAFVNQRIT